MRAGELKYALVFESPVVVTSPTGAVTKFYKEAFRCRAGRKKQTLHATTENAYEETISQSVVMYTYAYPQIQYGCRVKYAGCYWEIRMLEPEANMVTITLKKMDV